MGFSTVNNGEPYSNWLNNDEILSTQLRGSKGSLKALGWELVWPSTQAARSTKPLPCLPVCPSHNDSMVSDGLKLLPTVPPGLGASSLDLIHPGSIVGIPRNHPEVCLDYPCGNLYPSTHTWLWGRQIPVSLAGVIEIGSRIHFSTNYSPIRNCQPWRKRQKGTNRDELLKRSHCNYQCHLTPLNQPRTFSSYERLRISYL